MIDIMACHISGGVFSRAEIGIVMREDMVCSLPKFVRVDLMKFIEGSVLFGHRDQMSLEPRNRSNLAPRYVP